jgi:oxygen-independent coproporphyrinogen-3 oxidase
MIGSLIDKYNIPGPRYTSYPTVPYWSNDTFTVSEWIDTVKKSFQESNDSQGISVYIHLPYCENLCTFCACHKRITKNHEVEDPYIDAVLQEWKLYATLLGTIHIKELHLGGGTPTFFKPQLLKKLISGLLEDAVIKPNPEFSFEGHPNNTTIEHLEVLHQLGFTRVSFGVQDYDEKVQRTINRIQPFENVKKVTEAARKIGYESIIHDLIFGLPFQTWETVAATIEKTRQLKPDRIAFYSYAHVPWVKGVGQRGFDEKDLPEASLKRLIYENSKRKFEESGYHEIGMDHFALPDDKLYKAVAENTLHRNFMGYTSSATKLLIGLGMSAISDSWYGFAQNEKTVETYMKQVQEGILPVFRGHILNKEDLAIRRHILNIMCRFETLLGNDCLNNEENIAILERLVEPKRDGLVIIDGNKITVTEEGRAFVRNIAMAFDLLLLRQQPDTRIFSLTI